MSKMNNSLERRRERYFDLNSRLSAMDDNQLRSLYAQSEGTRGWGSNHVIRIGRNRVFVKRVPVTKLEHENPYCTRNLYRLPLYYNYGVGSAGFGVYREIIAHIKTTNWVLSGAIENFPLLYHHRVMPVIEDRPRPNLKQGREYVRYWNGNENIGRYMLDRTKAKHEAVLFLEHIPHTLDPWLSKDLTRLALVFEQIKKSVNFLRANGIIHFDCHYDNILTDGSRMYLTDFGLVLDRSFSLNKRERDFFSRHTYYDYGELMMSAGKYLFHEFEKLPSTRRERIKTRFIDEKANFFGVKSALLQNLEEIHEHGLIKLDDSYVCQMLRYRKVIRMMDGFFDEMFRSNKKDARYSNTRLRRLLRECGFLTP